jgi:uncharacterized protein (TIGR04255 family)
LVICEVRSVASSKINLDADAGLRLQKAATRGGFAVDRLEPAQQQAIEMQFVPGQPPQPKVDSVTSGWQLFGSDGFSVATILPNVATIQTSRYTSWDNTFRPLLHGLITAISDVQSPTILQRIGLRYIDRLVDESAQRPSFWRDKLTSQILGPIADPHLSDMVVTAQQQVELRIDENRRALLRHGPFPDGAAHGAISYLIDIDVFDNNSSVFSIDDILEKSDDLNLVALSLFQATLAPDYLAKLRGNG